jgi:hypothetical protein
MKNYISGGLHGRIRYQYFVIKGVGKAREMDGKN